MALVVGVPVAVILAVAVYVSAGGKFGGEARRTINYSVPTSK